MNPLYLMISFSSSLLLTMILTRIWIKKVRNKYKGIDVHKEDKPEVAEMGGIPLLIGFLTPLIFFSDAQLIALTVFLVSLVGIVDDISGLSHSEKIVLPILASIPYSVFGDLSPWIDFPFLLPVYFGVFYKLLLVPLWISASANSINVMAGFNGLEAGMCLIASFFLMPIAIDTGNLTSALVLSSFMGSLVAFLYYNRYPSRVFPGDVGTFGMGATIALLSIEMKVEFIAFLLLLPHFTDFFMKSTSLFKGRERHGHVILKGKYLVPPKHLSILHVPLRITPMTERSLVLLMYSVEVEMGILALFTYYFLFS